jgi:hypothetical protein
VTEEEVDKTARQQLQQQNPEYADNPMMLGYFEQRVGQQLVQKQILLAEADKLGIHVTERRREPVSCTPARPARLFFPTGSTSARTHTPR